jgi:hypothetical protein
MENHLQLYPFDLIMELVPKALSLKIRESRADFGSGIASQIAL